MTESDRFNWVKRSRITEKSNYRGLNSCLLSELVLSLVAYESYGQIPEHIKLFLKNVQQTKTKYVKIIVTIQCTREP